MPTVTAKSYMGFLAVEGGVRLFGKTHRGHGEGRDERSGEEEAQGARLRITPPACTLVL